ncbi:MAG: ABC transporter permease [Anaerolineae bacterium]
MKRAFGPFNLLRPERTIGIADGAILAALAALLYMVVRIAVGAPAVVRGPDISLSPTALPWYALLSLGRMAAAYLLAMVFTLVYGRAAASSPHGERLLVPLLDVLQSVPILSFLPVVLLGLSAVLPAAVAAELASIVLIFTSQAWNLTFAWYQSLRTIPKDLNEAAATFRFDGWQRLKTLELPFAGISLIWNSMMSWAGGWFFLMAAEIFTVGERDFRLPGLGAYLQEAANAGNVIAIAWGLATLIALIVALDQLVWRPLLAWSDRFKLAMVESDNPPTSWFYDAARGSRLLSWLGSRVWQPIGAALDRAMPRFFSQRAPATPAARNGGWPRRAIEYLLGLALLYGCYLAVRMILFVPVPEWLAIGAGLGATLLRVFIALVLALAWTIPVGVAIGTNPVLSARLQPLVQIAASVPATALFPLLLLLLLRLPAGLNLAAVLFMLAGTQWYLLFNVIAGASAIPQDLKYTSALLGLNRRDRWRTLILPALFPYLVTGAITASGGAWNASIVAERVRFAGNTVQTTGIGSLIGSATATGDYPLLLAATLTMIVAVAVLNRVLWNRMYRAAETRYRLE